MRILYAIQGTGNGHLSRARDIVPLLHKIGDLDVLISGTQADIHLPYPVKYKFKGLSFVFGKKGGIDLMETYKKSNLRRFLKEINSLPVERYDLVISDFEPVSSWACYIKNKECISLSHQAAVLNKHSPKPKHADIVGKAILKFYAPATTYYGFHFEAYDKNISTPVIRQQIRELEIDKKGHYTVYLPSYDDKHIMRVLSECKDVKWEVFSKHNKRPLVEKNVFVYPVTNEAFINSMAASEGVICGAGFETPAEAMYLGKKLLVIPMKSQYEQHCNAAALCSMGIPVLKSLKKKHCDKISEWIDSSPKLSVNYPDITKQILDDIVNAHAQTRIHEPVSQLPKVDFSIRDFKRLTLKKILSHIAR